MPIDDFSNQKLEFRIHQRKGSAYGKLSTLPKLPDKSRRKSSLGADLYNFVAVMNPLNTEKSTDTCQLPLSDISFYSGLFRLKSVLKVYSIKGGGELNSKNSLKI